MRSAWTSSLGWHGGGAEHGFGDAVGKRPGRLDQADDRHDDPEEAVVIRGAEAGQPDELQARDARHHGVGALAAAIAEEDAVDHEDPEELLHQRAEAVGADFGGVEPGDE